MDEHPAQGQAVTARPAGEITGDTGTATTVTTATAAELVPPPAQLTTFVGRTGEVAEVGRLLAEERLVTLTGPGGSGKTRLAIEAAAAAARSFEDGVAWVDLSATVDDAGVPRAVADALGLRDTAQPPTPARLIERLCGRQRLLVLDNAEQVAAATAVLVDALLRGCPCLTVLVTSREALGVDGEVRWAVPPLLPGEAVELFAARARSHRRDFRVPTAGEAAVAELCARLDGLPLAIEFAAARMRLMTLDQITAGLSDRFRLLTGVSHLRPTRQQTLRASIDWSHDLLSPTEQALLRRMSVFAGGATLDALEHVCAVGTDDGVRDGDEAALDLLASLVDKSLVHVDAVGAQARYRLLETVREYAAERLDAAGERARVRDRHLTYFLEVAEAAHPRLIGDTSDALPTLDAEIGNLREAIRHGLTAPDPDLALRLSFALWNYFSIRGHPAEGIEWIQSALERGGSPGPRAWGLTALQNLGVQTGDFNLAETAGREALPTARELDDPPLLMTVLSELAVTSGWQDAPLARRFAEEALTLARTRGADEQVVHALTALGWTYVARDDHATARPLLDEAWDLGAACGLVGKTYAPAMLALGAARTGELDRAARAASAVLDGTQGRTELVPLTFADAALAQVEAGRGDWPAARQRLSARVALLTRENLYRHGTYVQAHLAEAVLGEGDTEAAEEAIPDPLTGVGDQPMPSIQAWCLLLRGRLRLAVGHLDAAAEDVAAARRFNAATQNLWQEAVADHVAGRLARAAAALDEAESLHRRALAQQLDQGYRPDVADSLEALAAVRAELGDPAAATRMVAAAAALRAELGWQRRPIDQPCYDADIAALRGRVGGDALAAAFDEAAATGADAAISAAVHAPAARQHATTGWGSLTPTERDVVRLVAQGLSNPEVGQRLFMARGTVKAHLTHVFGKLGVTSRAELAAEATRREQLGSAAS